MNTYNQVNPITLGKRPSPNKYNKSGSEGQSTLPPEQHNTENVTSSFGNSIPEIRARLKNERKKAMINESLSKEAKNNKEEVDYIPQFDHILEPISRLINEPLPPSFYRFVEKEYRAAKTLRLPNKRLKLVSREIRLLLKAAIAKGALHKNDWDQQHLTRVFSTKTNGNPINSQERLCCFLSPEERRIIIDGIPYEQLGIEPPNVSTSTNNTNNYQVIDPTSIVTVETQSKVPPPPPPIDSRPTPPWAQNIRTADPLLNQQTKPKELPVPSVSLESRITNLNAPSPSSVPKKIAAQDEKSRRLERLKRFASPEPLTSTSKRVKIDDDDSYSDLNAITNKAYKFDKNKPIVGQCQVLEKKYLRLTSEPDPAKVRPLSVLIKALDWIVTKFRSGSCSYQYFCDQLKSIRQDLKVQMIENDFTVTVYKTHARAALENGDVGEYNQCQSSLKPLFEKDNIDKGDLPEFISYRILYHMMTSDHSSINQLHFQLLTTLRHMYDNEMIQRALKMSEAQIENNYHTFMRLYQQTKGPERHLVNQFVKKERLNALNCMCRAYARLPLQFLAPELHFNDATEAFEFLTELELIQFMVVPESDPNEIYLDCKSCRSTIIKHFGDAKRIDIKGQI
ncbi:Thp3 [Kluyveromyces lactis]|nr:Thp3 [Kluyveromyces lactis]